MTVNHDPVLVTGGGSRRVDVVPLRIRRFPLRVGLRDFAGWLAAHPV